MNTNKQQTSETHWIKHPISQKEIKAKIAALEAMAETFKGTASEKMYKNMVKNLKKLLKN